MIQELGEGLTPKRRMHAPHHRSASQRLIIPLPVTAGKQLFRGSSPASLLATIIQVLGPPEQRLMSVMRGHPEFDAVLQGMLAGYPKELDDSPLAKR